MATLLSNLVNHIDGGIHKIKFKDGHCNKKCELCGIKYKDLEHFFEYTKVKYDLMVYKCSYCT